MTELYWIGFHFSFNLAIDIIIPHLYEKRCNELEAVLGCGLVYRIPVPRSFLVEVCGEKEEQIEKGINLGLIEESSEREEENRLYRVSPILPQTISSVHLPVREQELLLLQRQAYNLLNSLWANKENRNEERWREIFRLAFADQQNSDRFREQFTKMISVQFNHAADLAYEKELRKEKEYLTANQERIYQRLEEYLRQKDWKKADYETALIMYQWMVIENYDDYYALFTGISVVYVIKEIDRLWIQYSNQQFGITGQVKIYSELVLEVYYKVYYELRGTGTDITESAESEIWVRFSHRVGWKQGERWLQLEQLYSTTETQNYHFPVLMYYREFYGGFWVGSWGVGRVVTDRLSSLERMRILGWEWELGSGGGGGGGDLLSRVKTVVYKVTRLCKYLRAGNFR